MIPYGRQSVNEEDIEAVAEVLRGDWLTTGPTVARFEKELAGLTGAPRVITATSGTAALHMAYAGAGVGSGDEVITTPMTFVATASCALALGADITFVDIEDDTANIDPKLVAQAASKRTKVVAGVDYAGHPVDVDALRTTTTKVDALLLEDAAHSIGSLYKGKEVGSLADLTTFSFFPTKNMTTTEGGAVAALDARVAQAVDEFHMIGRVMEPERMRHQDEGAWYYEMSRWGLNYRLSDVQCALGLSQLKRLASFKEARKRVFARYAEGLAGIEGVRLPVQRDDVDPIWHLYPLRVLNGRRREVFDKLRADGIGVQVNYIPVYWHPMFEDLGYKRGMCPVAEEFYAQEISLPMYAELTDAQIDQTIEAVRKAVA